MSTSTRRIDKDELGVLWNDLDHVAGVIDREAYKLLRTVAANPGASRD